MLRLALALMLTLPLSAVAAPIPKAVQKKATPVLEEATWAATHHGMPDLGRIEYTFQPDGKLVYKYANGSTYTQGSWRQDGGKLYWECNNKYAEFDLEFQDGKFEGSARNVAGKAWKVTLEPVSQR